MKRSLFILFLLHGTALAHGGSLTMSQEQQTDIPWVLLYLFCSFLFLLWTLGKGHPLRLLAVANLTAPMILAAFINRVDFFENDHHRYVTSNGVPNHAVSASRFPMREQNYRFSFPKNPQIANSTTPVGMNLFGVAIDGVPFDPATAEFWRGDPRWNVNAFAVDLNIDEHNAHIQPPTGAYHYHANPWDQEKEFLVGYAADGFAIVNDRCGIKKVESGYRLKPGKRPSGTAGPGGDYDGTYTADWEFKSGAGDLDECNGHKVKDSYHYHLTEEYPHVPRYWKGTPNPSFFKRGPRRR